MDIKKVQELKTLKEKNIANRDCDIKVDWQQIESVLYSNRSRTESIRGSNFKLEDFNV